MAKIFIAVVGFSSWIESQIEVVNFIFTKFALFSTAKVNNKKQVLHYGHKSDFFRLIKTGSGPDGNNMYRIVYFLNKTGLTILHYIWRLNLVYNLNIRIYKVFEWEKFIIDKRQFFIVMPLK